jgi:hypothetical protein
MTSMQLSCAETPLHWPTSASLSDLTTCKSCGFILHAPNPGSLQVQTRRAGDGVGDGVNIMEAADVGLDYRGQRYGFEEAVFHTPGLHIFPGEKEVFPAEYHLHFRTFVAPMRSVTIVIPVSHRVTGVGQDYFAAISRSPDPAAQRPTLATLLIPGTDVLQYQATDIRQRTAENPTPASCGDIAERQMLLVLRPCGIYASDLERIPREGSLSTNPRDLPAPGIKNKQQLPLDRLKRTLVLAQPGILGGETMSATDGLVIPGGGVEMECKPMKIVDGRDVVDISGQDVDLRQLLGLGGGSGLQSTKDGLLTGDKQTRAIQEQSDRIIDIGKRIMGAALFLCGLFLADWLVSKFLWPLFFDKSTDTLGILTTPSRLKIVFFVLISIGYAQQDGANMSILSSIRS